jgi:hypothetical protein
MKHHTPKLLHFLLFLCALAACTEPPATTPPPVASSGRNLVVTAANVTGCEAVVRGVGVAGATDTAVEIPTVVFSSAVVGEAVPRAPHLAIAFVVSGSADLQNKEVASFHFIGNSQPPTLVNVRCHTTAGATIDGGLQLIN